MAIRRVNPYAKAYSFGTEGNAALAGSPISKRRPLDTPPTRAPRRRGWLVPHWIVVVILSILFLTMVNMYARVNEQKEILREEIAHQHSELARSKERMEELDAELELAADENRILSSAVNRLGMQMPTRDQLYSIPAPHVVREQDLAEGQKKDSISIFKVIMNLIGQ